MNIKASFYDIFAYTIPGGMLLIILLFGMKAFEVFDLFPVLQNANFSTLLMFGISSHVLGFLITPITHYFGKNYKTNEKLYLIAYKAVINRNPNLETHNINPADWAIWFAKIKHDNLETANGIDQYLAYSKMMRGVGFACLISCALLISCVLFNKIASQYLFFAPLLIFLMALAILQGKKFNQGFYTLIFETVFSKQSPFTINNGKN